MHDYRNYLFREAFRPIYPFFDKQDIDEANVRLCKLPRWERLEAACDAVLEYFPAAGKDAI